MPFSSYLGKSRRAGGLWAATTTANSLPTTTTSSKSKLPSRKSRKRPVFISFLLSNFFTLIVTFSLLFFLLTIFLYGIPKPLSSHFKHRPLSSHRSFRPRKPINGSSSSSLFGAKVDISTKELYDRIEFLDIDGGPWKQGWRVGYRGNEWDDEKLKVFVVPHSHNDPGWKLTVEEYYDRQSRHILDTIVETLSKVALLFKGMDFVD